MPIPLTSLTIFRIFSKPDFLPAKSLHAAPMQNLVDPFSLASRAACRTGSMSIKRDALVGVLYEEDWEQYLQSSVHPPAARVRLRPSIDSLLAITKLTFDVHERAKLDSPGVMVHSVDVGLIRVQLECK